MAVTPPELMRRVYRQMEIGKGIRLSAEEVDLMAEMGALKAMSAYTAEYVVRQAEERLVAARSKMPATSTSRISPRSGRHHEETGAEAVERALAACRPRKRPER